MQRLIHRARCVLGRFMGQPGAVENGGANKTDVAQVRVRVASMIESWVREADVGDVEREQRKKTAGQPGAVENGGANKTDVAQVRKRVASMIESWVREADVGDVEREQRKKTALEMERALLHKVRFDSDEEEMAWLKVKAAELGKHESFEAWLEENSLDTPGKVWGANAPFGLRFVRQLGPHMTIGHMLFLTSLPDGLHVNGDLNLHGCTGLASLPDGLHVEGNLNLESCTGFTLLADGLRVKGDLNCKGCTGLKSLPDGLHIGGNLDLKGCAVLTSLPEGLHVDGNLNLENCTRLSSLPNGMHANGDLNLHGCTGLAMLPDGLRVEGGLDLYCCSRLTSLPDGLHVDGSLDLYSCAGLTSLPDSLHVEGNLNSRFCFRLASLPDGLRVGGNLHLEDCIHLTSLPDGLRVDGYLNLRRCTGLTLLPDCVLEWGMCSNGEPHDIYLAGSGLSPEELARLQTLENPALRFHVSIDETETFGGAGLAADDFPTLDAAAAFWAKEAGFPSELAISPFVEVAYVRGVLGFLSKLRRAKEFNNSLTKKGLASRVVQVLELLTGEDNGVREELQVRMADAVDTCSDKPMWALNQMQVLVHICNAQGDRTKLRALGMGVMRLEVVHRHVRKAMDAMNFIDDVCVYLRFEIALRESLNLPVSALEMIYPSYITVTQESIDAAEKEALQLTDDDLQAWLPAWSEWQRQDRVEFAGSLDFSALERNSRFTTESPDNLELRSVLGNKVADPVRLKPLATVWSLQDLLKHWVNTGMDLNNTPRDVDYMRLNLTKCM